jgi:hypothetical protein
VEKIELALVQALINVGLLLNAIKSKGWSGIKDAAVFCHVNERTLKKLMQGQIPRLDALFRICDGCGIKLQELIIATSHKTTTGQGRRVLPGRWQAKSVSKDQG